MDLFSKAFPLVSDKATTVDRYGVSVLRFVANAFPEIDCRMPGCGHRDHLRTGVLSAIALRAARSARDVGFGADEVSPVIAQRYRAVHASIDSASPHLFRIDRPQVKYSERLRHKLGRDGPHFILSPNRGAIFDRVSSGRLLA